MKALAKGSAVVCNGAVGTETTARGTKLVRVFVAHRVLAGASFASASAIELDTLEVAMRTRLADFFALIAITIKSAQNSMFRIATVKA